MKKVFLILLFVSFSLNQALATSLRDALSLAYKKNSELNAERENINVAKQELKISKSDYFPTATITTSKSKEDTNKLTNQSGSDATISDVDPLNTSVKLEQTLIDFGRGADYTKNKIGIELSEAQLLKKEQLIFYKVIEVFSEVISSEEKLKINQKNLSLLQRQVENDKIRLERGQITISDLSQSESSLAGARAQFIQAKNDFVTSKLNYENVIGELKDSKLLEKKLNAIVAIPNSLNNALELSRKKNPDIIITSLELEQAEQDIKIAKSDLAPTATLSLERSYVEDLSATYDEREKDTLKATVSWPFYSGGKNIAKINKNRNLKNRKKLLLENAVKTTSTNVASAWSKLNTSRSFLNAIKSQVGASEIANEGISAEYEVGSRTTLDVIQSNTLLLNAKISLADSERNYLLAQYNLLKSIGLLNSNYLKIQ